ncbi:MAG: leucine-rich repeat protein [Ruminococcus sp.]|nr:leucine-rich repeat protein [Ruminococcus sp.]
MKIKKILSTAMALTMVMPYMSTNLRTSDIPSAFAESETKVLSSGTCGAQGDNLTWTLDSEGTLTISGKGEMTDCGETFITPWSSYTENIVSVIIEDGVTTIGHTMFYDCSNLTSVTIPDSVTSIGDGAFEGCTKLNSIKIPDSVTEIGGSAFKNTPWLNAQIMKDPIVIVNNILIEGKNCTGNVVIPNSVTKIANNAFYECKGLTSVTIPDSVTSIGIYTFKYCHGLTSITIPDSVTSIGSRAFEYCSGLTSITIPDSVTSIGDDAFLATPWLRSKQEEDPLVIVNGILTDGKTCKGDVVIPDSVTSIGGCAFEYCQNLTSITIPASVTSIGENAFSSCEYLTSINVDSENKYYASEDGLLCNKDKTLLIQFPNGKNIPKYAIPDCITTIGDYAFKGCNLTTVTIPDSVTAIGAYSFVYCKKLNSITIENPKCEIHYSEDTISDTATIYGYEGSTAQAYAEKYDRKFVAIDTPTPIPTPTTAGDANNDGKVLLNDAVLILQHLGNPDAYPLSDQARANADVSNHGDGITNSDALAIQKYVLGLIPDLPNYS